MKNPLKIRGFFCLIFYFNSCSKLRKSSVLKKSTIVIFSPSQIFLMVEMVVDFV